MKKLSLLVIPLMSILLLANCGSKSHSIEHFVTFESNGGSHVDTQRVNDGGVASEPAKPTKTDYTFKGWYISPDFVGDGYNFSTPVTKDITLYANWDGGSQLIKITFDGDGGYFENTKSKTIIDVYTPYGQIPVAPTPIKDKTSEFTYTFKGWNKALEPAKSETTYTAQWIETKNKYHVTFDANGGTITSGGDPIDVNYGETIITAPTVTRDGYDASTVAWYDAATGGNKFTFGISSVTNDLTLFAHWGDVKKYTVVFNANGGTYSETSSGTVTRENVIYNTMPSIPSIPTKVDSTGVKAYTFIGYDKNVVPVTGDNVNPIVYTAQWVEATNVYAITINANGGHFNDGKTSKTYNIAAGANLKSFVSALVNPTYDVATAVKIYDKYVYNNDTEIGDDDIVDKDGIIIKAIYRNKTLEECSWDEINTISSQGATFAESFFGSISRDNPITKTVMVNGQPHKVRIIGYGEDYTDLNDPSTAIGITFEFANLISDNQGYSLATQWNDTNNKSTANYNYLDSSVRMALVGENQEKGHILWAQKGEATWSTNSLYKNRTVLSMLPYDLISVLKTPSKYINTHKESTWEEKTVEDKLFLLSPFEMGENERSDFEESRTTTYSYYNGAQDTDRVKKQIKNDSYTKTCSINYVSESGQVYQNNVISYAGYNGSTHGGIPWLRSPSTNSAENAWRVNGSGNFDNDNTNVYNIAYAVAPAFCI